MKETKIEKYPHITEKKDIKKNIEEEEVDGENLEQVELKFTSEIDDKKFERENIWQIHNKYIVSQIKSGLVIIDQHAAHERILYEKCLKYLRKGVKNSQNLLFPVKLRLSKEDFLILRELLSMLTKIGFSIEISGKDTAILNAVPTYIRHGKEEILIQEILEQYKNEELETFDREHRLAASFACRAAIMSGDCLSSNEMNRLIDELFATEFPFFCPHGRPTIINISLKELDKKFHR